jgi:MFS family permease
LSTVTFPGETAAPASHKADLYRIVVLAILFSTLAAFLGAYTLEKLVFLYKGPLHLTPGEVGTVGIIVGIPTYLQPFMGAFSDLNPLFGYHRRSYFVLGGVIGAAGFLSLALQAHYSYWTVIALVMIATAGGIMINVVLNAVLVVVGNATGTFGRLQTLLYLISYGWVLVYTGHLRGYVTQNWSYRHAFEAAAAVLLAMTLLVFLIPEKRQSRHALSPAPEDLLARNAARLAERQRTLSILRSAAASPGLWVLVFFIFYLIVTPGTNTAQIYYENDALHLSPQFIGNLSRWTAAGVLAALALYGVASSRLSARVLVFGAWLMDCSAYLLLLNIHNAASAEWVSLLVALSGTIYGLCLYTLAGRACPVGAEGAVYGLVLSAIALGGTLGDKLGGTLYDVFGPSSHHTVTHGWTSMLWFGFGFTVIAAGFIPFLPAWTRSSERLSAAPQEPTA